MTTQPKAPAPPSAASPAPTGGIEAFVQSPIGKLIVGILTPITRVTVMKGKDAQGKTVEKTPLDTLNGTVIYGIVLTVILIAAVRIAAVVSHNMGM